MVERIYAVFGKQVRSRREALAMKQATLSELVGLSRASIANIEAGRQVVTLHQVLAFAKALAVPAGELLPPIEPAVTDRSDLPIDVRRFLAETVSSSPPRTEQ